MKHALLTLILGVVLILSAPQPALAWGSSGHRTIAVLAVRNLPADLPDFLKSDDAVWQIGELAREPDRWRGSGIVHDAERDPGHFVNIGDDLTIAGLPLLSALPATRLDYDGALRTNGSSQYRVGYLPYSIIDGWQQLKTDFAYWRVDVASAKFAKSEEAREWFEKDRRLREALTIRDLGVWSHFVGDASQPMHVSVHYDGWGNFPNPEGFTQKHGVHLHFEGAFVRANVSDADVAAAMTAIRDCACTIETRTVTYLTVTQSHVVPLYRLEKAQAFESGTPEGKAFAVERVAAGASELRDMIIDAWNASRSGRIGYPAVAVSDVENGTADALGPLRGED